jgi:protein disulfide-isomerase
MRSLKFVLVLVCAVFGGSVFAAGEGWLTNFKEAKKEAAAKNLPILVEFSGSDWCKYCVRMENEVFSKKAFKDYVKDNFVLLFIDFPMKTKLAPELKKQNDNLASIYGVRVFPTVLILDKEGQVLNVSHYAPGGVDVFLEFLKKIKAGLK